MAFVLSCKCGKQIPVTAGAAGTSINCADCGHAIKVPSFGQLRELPRSYDVSEIADTDNPLPYPRAARLASVLLIGFGVLIIFVGVGLFLGNVTRLFPTLPYAGGAVMAVGVAVLGAGCRALAENRGD